jgi:hypothetical protein
MNLLAALRYYHSRGIRRAAVVFVVGWLGFAAAPCQAMDIEFPTEAPHHDSMPADECGHCPPAGDKAANCANAAAADCLAATSPLIDIRELDHPKPVGMPAPIRAAFASGPVRPRHRLQNAAASPLPHASIQQRYCSYLK